MIVYFPDFPKFKLIALARKMGASANPNEAHFAWPGNIAPGRETFLPFGKRERLFDPNGLFICPDYPKFNLIEPYARIWAY